MIGEDIRARVFRDTKTYYLSAPADFVLPSSVDFVTKHAGRNILDLGCATGAYCAHLSRLGRNVKGADANPEYVRIACERGVDAHVMRDRAPFPDQSFDTVLLFEVLEHLEAPERILLEARRLARRNVLITTPNSEGALELQRSGLLFEHFADLDHRNFFTPETLRELLAPHFPRVTVEAGEGLRPYALLPFRPLRAVARALAKAGILVPRYYARLFAVAEAPPPALTDPPR